MIDRRPPVSGATRTFAVVGHPVHHSRSPALHGAWLAEHGVDAVYVALPVEPARAEALVPALRTLGLAGANITVPFKEAAARGVDRCEGLAAALGVVNTVVRVGDALVGHNTDAEGFVDGLRHAFGDVARGARTVVIGAGGAGLAVGAGLAGAGAAEVLWLNRDEARAHQVAARVAALSTGARCSGAGWGAHPALLQADLVVVATSGPAEAAVSSLPLHRIPTEAVLVDLNYWASSPPWLLAHQARGGRTQDGWPMLVFQAARAFQHFTGISPDPARALAGIG